METGTNVKLYYGNEEIGQVSSINFKPSTTDDIFIVNPLFLNENISLTFSLKYKDMWSMYNYFFGGDIEKYYQNPIFKLVRKLKWKKTSGLD